MSKRQFPGIPEPTPLLSGYLETIRALKQSVELMIGTRGSVASTVTYVQALAPLPTDVKVGDRWIDSTSSIERYWSGTEWVDLA